jgi:copper chaperone
MTTFKVDGMTCGHCVRTVTRALTKVPGVERVLEVNLERGEARVEGAPDTAAVLAALRDEGFEATPSGA